MLKTLNILSSNNKSKKLDKCISGLGFKKQEIFYYNNNNISELKQLLVTKKFDIILLDYAFIDIKLYHIIKSLALKSKIVIWDS